MSRTPARRRAVFGVMTAVMIATLFSSVTPAAADPIPWGSSLSTAPPPAPGDCGDPIYEPDGSSPWTCSFDDEFDGTALDARKWMPITTASSGTTGGGACFTDSPNNISVADGMLNLTVRREAAAVRCKTPNGAFNTLATSGQVATYTKFAQAYGRFSIRAKFPSATIAGLQSALWLWPANALKYGAWPTSGEIDIAEEYSVFADRAVPYLHYLYDPKTVNLTTNTNIATNNYCTLSIGDFHEYTVVWTPTTITVLYDGQPCITDKFVAAVPNLPGAPFDQPFFIALTQSLGIGYNGVNAYTPLPATTQVDWVRAWK
jgi:beta-glucanase (GH16 family)